MTQGKTTVRWCGGHFARDERGMRGVIAIARAGYTRAMIDELAAFSDVLVKIWRTNCS